MPVTVYWSSMTGRALIRNSLSLAAISSKAALWPIMSTRVVMTSRTFAVIVCLPFLLVTWRQSVGNLARTSKLGAAASGRT